jgi:Xaa-Pro aminopeptidase
MDTQLQRLKILQSLLKQNQLDGFLIPHNDPHQNEYIPDYWDRRTWLSGFNGSNGDLLVLTDQIILWTDSRYTLQAKQQCADLPITIIQQRQSITQDIAQWLLAQNQPYTIGVDPKTMSIQNASLLTDALEQLGGQCLPIPSLVDELWTDQPTPLNIPAFALTDYPGASAQDKLTWLRADLAENNIDAFALNTLDDIAWLFNIRGKDIPHCPVCISYVWITETTALWFVDPDKIDDQLQQYCAAQKITLMPYNDFQQTLNQFKGNLAFDLKQASWWMILEAHHADITPLTNPIVLKKSMKTSGEIDSMAQAHINDALALVEFMQWLENNWQAGLTEWDAANHLNQCRFNRPGNQDLSFDTISGFGSNGAIVHYRVQKDSAATIDPTNLYLVDSGGQYNNGTTDVTRVFHLGKPSANQKRDYTLVLKGHIDLAKAVFPKGTDGAALDALARHYLWDAALNFGHGTGHGVGYFLNVHEGPCGISPRAHVPLEPGMILSNEPGLYREGEYGIRIENLQAVISHQKNSFGEFYAFKTLTLVPYALNLIETALLDKEQIQWLNDYHQKVYSTLSPHCPESLKTWLKQATTSLQAA